MAQKEKKNRMKEYAEAVRTTHMVAGPPAGPRKVQQDTVQVLPQYTLRPNLGYSNTILGAKTDSSLTETESQRIC